MCSECLRVRTILVCSRIKGPLPCAFALYPCTPHSFNTIKTNTDFGFVLWFCQIFVRGVEVRDAVKSTTLADMEVYPGEDIRVVDTDIWDNNDVVAANELIGMDVTPAEAEALCAKANGRAPERGFKDTALQNFKPARIPSSDKLMDADDAAVPECLQVDDD